MKGHPNTTNCPRCGRRGPQCMCTLDDLQGHGNGKGMRPQSDAKTLTDGRVGFRLAYGFNLLRLSGDME